MNNELDFIIDSDNENSNLPVALSLTNNSILHIDHNINRQSSLELSAHQSTQLVEESIFLSEPQINDIEDRIEFDHESEINPERDTLTGSLSNKFTSQSLDITDSDKLEFLDIQAIDDILFAVQNLLDKNLKNNIKLDVDLKISDLPSEILAESHITAFDKQGRPSAGKNIHRF